MRLPELILVAAALTACAPTPPEAPGPQPAESTGPFNLILFIGDGMGLNYWSALRLAREDAAIEAFPVTGLVGTASADSWITDSAAGATAYASGVKTYNYAIGVDVDTSAVETVLERAADRGKATGLVATSTITHATPAAFAAHVADRSMEFDIAAQMVAAEVDVMLGGGSIFFDATERPDGVDLLGALAKRATLVDAEALDTLDASGLDRLVSFTAPESPPAAASRAQNLGLLTDLALQVLSRDRDGFFLMVEASQPDWRGHDRAPLTQVVAEILDLDLALRAALRFRDENPNTLIVVTADHETGGLALHGDEMGVFRANYTSDGHTAGMVPLFAIGPGADLFGGIHENDEVGRLLMALIRADGPAALRY